MMITEALNTLLVEHLMSAKTFHQASKILHLLSRGIRHLVAFCTMLLTVLVEVFISRLTLVQTILPTFSMIRLLVMCVTIRICEK